MKNLKKIIKILRCLKCNSDLKLVGENLVCKCCGKKYEIKNNVLRFVDKKFYELNEDNSDIQNKTKNYFGHEWDYFKNWGFISKKDLAKDDLINWLGGTVEERISAFKGKCRLTKADLKNSNFILDAGCGNGRYTFETARQTESLVIGVDIGFGSVKSAYENTSKLKNVIIIQASLFNLPFKNESIDACFSNGVLMHTGNAKKSFNEISRTIKKSGVFVAHLYHKLNFIWEINDYLLRKYTTKLSVKDGMKFAKRLSGFAKKLNKIPFLLEFTNLFFRLQPTVIHMFDWYSAPIATHHTYPEVNGWFKNNDFKIMFSKHNKKYYFYRPWALNIRGIKK